MDISSYVRIATAILGLPRDCPKKDNFVRLKDASALLSANQGLQRGCPEKDCFALNYKEMTLYRI